MKNARYNNIAAIILLLVSVAPHLYSCKQKPAIGPDLTTRIEFFGKSYKDFTFSAVRIVPLQTTNHNMHGNHINIKLFRKRIFISDQDYGSVFIYNSDGHYIDKTGIRGPGPQEYPNLADFSVFNDTVEVLSVTGQNSVISGYSYDGQLMYSRKFDLSVAGFGKYNQGYLLYTSFQHALHPWRLYSANFDGEITGTFLESVPGFNIPITEQNFYATDSLIIFKEAFSNRVFTYSSGELSEWFIIDFGKYNVPDNFLKTDFFKGFEMLNQRGFAVIRNLSDNPFYTVFEVITQKNGEENQLYNLIFDKANHTFFRRHFGNADEEMPGQLVDITDNNELVYLTFPHQLTKNQNQMKQLPVENLELLEQVSETDNPVLLFCKISTRNNPVNKQ